MNASKSKRKIELGDWQTPLDLAQKTCRILVEAGISPAL